MTGKDKCKILKQIRQEIAQENDIRLVTAECKYQGECSGTCPRCEAEVRQLEQELEKRRQLGKQIAVAGVATAIVATMGGCRAISSMIREVIDESTQGILPANYSNSIE